jgi:hypothetical protein
MRLPALVALACACLLVAVPASAQDQTETPQELFKKVLLADPHLASGVKRLLNADTGFVSPSPLFADLTGDGKSDAVVTVDNGGVAGVVAAYILTAEGSSKGDLHVALRNQSLYQGRVRLDGTTLTIAEPLWSRGDDVCCPRKAAERDYAWDAAKKAFTRRATRTVPLLDR